jgi:hypothetical protein
VDEGASTDAHHFTEASERFSLRHAKTTRLAMGVDALHYEPVEATGRTPVSVVPVADPKEDPTSNHAIQSA